MSRIRGRDTRPEMILRSGLHRRGLRFRLHSKQLPGSPDVVLARHKVAILAHGCFWHGHKCPLFKLPATRREFWGAKIDGNSKRDRRTLAALADAGWRVLIVWECSLKGSGRLPLEKVLEFCEQFIRAGRPDFAELQGATRAKVVVRPYM